MTTKLILDFGNTLTKAAVFKDNEMIHLESHASFHVNGVRALLDRYPDISGSIISSVIHHPEEVNRFLDENTHLIILDEKTPLPVIQEYKDPISLGKDRVAAAVAASTSHPGKNVLIVMAGTCITYDFVDAGNRHHGGGISPGVNMRFRALNAFTGKLPLVSGKPPVPLTGNTTRGSILSGVLIGTLEEIRGIINRYEERYDSLTIILSGGDANYFDKRLKNNIFAVRNIVIQGLNVIFDFNANLEDQN